LIIQWYVVSRKLQSRCIHTAHSANSCSWRPLTAGKRQLTNANIPAGAGRQLSVVKTADVPRLLQLTTDN
jgi:hypothetical protein